MNSFFAAVAAATCGAFGPSAPPVPGVDGSEGATSPPSPEVPSTPPQSPRPAALRRSPRQSPPEASDGGTTGELPVTVPEFPLPTPKREGTKKKQQPPKDSRRDLSDVVKERTTRKDGTVRPDAEMPPRDMPLGPWPTLEAAIRELKTWAGQHGAGRL